MTNRTVDLVSQDYHPLRHYINHDSFLMYENFTDHEMGVRVSSKRFLLWLVLVLLFVCHPRLARSGVGEVSLSIGYAEVRSPGGSARALKKAERVAEGDTILTSANGHVHIRFIDGGLVSVRPNSVFSIQEFKYTPGNPSGTVIRFSMTQGEVRSISGAAAQESRERFRLNTPLVAIGIRGTDFVTRANSEITVATVNQGAIVMAPHDSNCRIEGLGACEGQRARFLSADMLGLALVYRVGTFDPSFQSVQGSNEKRSTKPSSHEQVAKESTERAVAATQAQNHPEDFVQPSRLIWGRWASMPAPGDQMTIAFRDAMLGNEVTVGDGYFFLFRTPTGVNFLPSLKTQADFKLTASTAFHKLPSNELTAAYINSGRLTVDFATRQYETQLLLSGPGIQNQNVDFKGTINPTTGIFLGGNTALGSSLSGAFTLEGKQAGYSFRVPVGFGSIQGATIWGR